MLESKADELTKREGRLTAKINEMKFELEKLREQVKILKDLPAERDRYRNEAQDYKMRLIKLEMQLRKLKKEKAEKKLPKSQ